jgi:hypothetical protein
VIREPPSLACPLIAKPEGTLEALRANWLPDERRYDSSRVRGVCWPRNDVDQGTEHGDEQDQHGPSELGTSMVIVPAEIVDKAPDDEEDHQEDAEEDQHRPEDAQKGKVIGQHVDFPFMIQVTGQIAFEVEPWTLKGNQLPS